ncbi:MAG TPA: ribosome silencing factor [Clostridiales bacterium]|jgi:ribosome-associated protein|nr:ribosome silencing factor [Clostridiales bacterium]
MQEKELALQATQILYDHRAQDILGLRVAHLTVVTDYLVIASGTNALHVRALQEYLEEELEKKGVVRRRVEGEASGRWVVLDYGSVIVHLFHPEERAYYRLERLWDDGQNRLELPFNEDELVRERV